MTLQASTKTGSFRSNRRMIISIMVLILIWSMAMLNRHTFRAHYYGHRLKHAPDAQTHAYYFSRLCGMGDKAVGIARRLLEDPDADIRAAGVGVLHHVRSDRARRLLLGALSDPDQQVRDLAVLGLALFHDRQALEPLTGILAQPAEYPALAAAAALERIGGDQAIAALLQAAADHPIPSVRGQAIDSLGWLRAAQAVDTLVGLLTDDTVVQVELASERAIGQAFDYLRGQAGKHGLVFAPAASRPAPARIIADLAAQALRRITNQSFGFRSTDPPDRKNQAIRRWEEWARRRPAA